MRIKLVSDLHLEFGDINIKNDEGCDVLILSGDILIAEDLYKNPESCYAVMDPGALVHGMSRAYHFRNFLKRVSFQFPHVIYVAGNHEFYHGRWEASIQHLRDECAKYPNIHFLEMDTFKLDDVTFVGCTLWSDMNKGDPLTLHAIGSMMNDFRLIRHDGLGYTKLRPAHAMSRHRKSVDYIRTVIEGKFDEKFVVVGHHAPSPLSTPDEYKHEVLMNGGYSSDLSNFIIDHPQIKLWTHGHTHFPFDYVIGETRILCNPRGYVGEPYKGFDPTKTVEV